MDRKKLKYYFIAGEASGDLHGGNLLHALRKINAEALFRGWGGDNMEEAGMQLVKHYRETSFMGFWEVVKNLPTIMGLFRLAKADIIKYKPDAVVLIDYPGFNLRLAKWLHKQHIPTIYYISPQVWAWKENRVHDIKKYIDLMLTILPFEKEFYKKYDYQVTYVGHPLLDEIKKYPSSKKRSTNDIIAILPGSRKQEIEKMLIPMMQAALQNETYTPIIAAPTSIDKNFYDRLLSQADIAADRYSIYQNQTYELLQKAKIALVSSGTATLETALCNVPQVVCYKGGKISYWIAKKLVKLPFISLVNLIADQKVVIELIQDDFEVNNIINAMEWTSQNAMIIKTKYQEIKKKLGGPGASERAAQAMEEYLEKVIA